MVGRLRKDFMKKMAIELKHEEWTGFGVVGNSRSTVDER
jgi:hypothetical protein